MIRCPKASLPLAYDISFDRCTFLSKPGSVTLVTLNRACAQPATHRVLVLVELRSLGVRLNSLTGSAHLAH